MKLITAFMIAALAAVAGVFVMKRLSHSGELPVEGFADGVPLTTVPTMQEAP